MKRVSFDSKDEIQHMHACMVKNKMKKVRFVSNVKIHHMYVWPFAYHEARKSDWMRIAADRYRFELRKQRLEAMLAKIGFLDNNF